MFCFCYAVILAMSTFVYLAVAVCQQSCSMRKYTTIESCQYIKPYSLCAFVRLTLFFSITPSSVCVHLAALSGSVRPNCSLTHTQTHLYFPTHKKHIHTKSKKPHMQIHTLCNKNSAAIQASPCRLYTQTQTTGGTHKPWRAHKHVYTHSHTVSCQASYQLGCQAIILAWGAREKCKCSSLSKSKVSPQS